MSGIKCRFKIVSSGSYLPNKKVTNDEIQARMNVSSEWILKSTGVETRYYAENETIASMAAKAITKAMAKSGLSYNEIDLMIAAGGTPDQPIPHNSALIHQELNLPSNITPMDINGTCLSFVHALQVASSLLQTKIYRNIIIVSSEKPSVGLNYNWPESAALFGDGAVAFIVSESSSDQGILFSDFETHSDGVHLAEIPAGGTRQHPKDVSESDGESFLFKMEGQQIYKLASVYLPDFFKKSLEKNNYTLDDFKMVVPHQASLMALSLMRNKLNISPEKFYINVHKYGNLVAASVAMSLHELLEEKKLVKGDQFLFLSTAAGLTLGNMGIKL